MAGSWVFIRARLVRFESGYLALTSGWSVGHRLSHRFWAMSWFWSSSLGALNSLYALRKLKRGVLPSLQRSWHGHSCEKRRKQRKHSLALPSQSRHHLHLTVCHPGGLVLLVLVLCRCICHRWGMLGLLASKQWHRGVQLRQRRSRTFSCCMMQMGTTLYPYKKFEQCSWTCCRLEKMKWKAHWKDRSSMSSKAATSVHWILLHSRDWRMLLGTQRHLERICLQTMPAGWVVKDLRWDVFCFSLS